MPRRKKQEGNNGESTSWDSKERRQAHQQIAKAEEEQHFSDWVRRVNELLKGYSN